LLIILSRENKEFTLEKSNKMKPKRRLKLIYK